MRQTATSRCLPRHCSPTNVWFRTRFVDAFRAATLEETIAGRIVLSIGCDTKSDTDLIALGQLTEAAKARLDELHKRKIDLADEILVLNQGGYIGASTRSEVLYAKQAGKPVRWRWPDSVPEWATAEREASERDATIRRCSHEWVERQKSGTMNSGLQQHDKQPWLF